MTDKIRGHFRQEVCLLKKTKCHELPLLFFKICVKQNQICIFVVVVVFKLDGWFLCTSWEMCVLWSIAWTDVLIQKERGRD